jgi:hypothetical protein
LVEEHLKDSVNETTIRRIRPCHVFIRVAILASHQQQACRESD